VYELLTVWLLLVLGFVIKPRLARYDLMLVGVGDAAQMIFVELFGSWALAAHSEETFFALSDKKRYPG